MDADGLIGFCPKYIRESTDVEMHLFANQLALDGAVKHAIFSMQLKLEAEKSVMHFGGWDTAIVDESKALAAEAGRVTDYPESGIYWANVHDKDHASHWEMMAHNIMANDQRLFLFQRKVILDSGASLMFFPMLEYQKFLSEIEKSGMDCFWKAQVGYRYCKCKADNSADPWPVVKILVGDDTYQHWVYLTGNDYLGLQVGDECLLMITVSDGVDYILLGDPFLRAYYTIHDMQAMKIGLVPSTKLQHELAEADAL